MIAAVPPSTDDAVAAVVAANAAIPRIASAPATTPAIAAVAAAIAQVEPAIASTRRDARPARAARVENRAATTSGPTTARSSRSTIGARSSSPPTTPTWRESVRAGCCGSGKAAAGSASDTSVEFTADGNGNIQRRFWIGWTEQPFDPEGRKWLAAMLPRFIRQSGIGAPARVARILKSGGVTGVLAEISLVEGSWGKRVYFSELMKAPGLSAADVQRAFAQAGHRDRLRLRARLVPDRQQPADRRRRRRDAPTSTRRRSIESDFELRRVLSSVLKAGVVPSPIAAGLLDASTSIDSDYEEASLLVAVRRPAAARRDRARPVLQGAGHRRQRLRAQPGAEDRAAAHRPVSRRRAPPRWSPPPAIGSDFEKASVLLQFVKNNSIEGPVRAPFFRAAGVDQFSLRTRPRAAGAGQAHGFVGRDDPRAVALGAGRSARTSSARRCCSRWPRPSR